MYANFFQNNVDLKDLAAFHQRLFRILNVTIRKYVYTPCKTPQKIKSTIDVPTFSINTIAPLLSRKIAAFGKAPTRTSGYATAASNNSDLFKKADEAVIHLLVNEILSGARKEEIGPIIEH